MGSSGDAMRLVAIYDKTRFDLLEWYEVDEINTTGNVRAPLVLHLRDKLGGEQLLFMVNHLYRSRDAERHKQAQLLNDWAANKTLPVIAVGDYNFDWEVTGGEQNHDQGFDLMTEGGAWEWIRPASVDDDAVQRVAVHLQQRAGLCLCGRPGAGLARRERDRRGGG